MTVEQISEYLAGWNEELNGDKDVNKEIANPTLEELEMFNISAGIPRQKVPKK